MKESLSIGELQAMKKISISKLIGGNPHKIHLKFKCFEIDDIIEVSFGNNIFIIKVMEEHYFNYKNPVKKTSELINGNGFFDEKNIMNKEISKGIISEFPVKLRKLSDKEALVYEI